MNRAAKALYDKEYRQRNAEMLFIKHKKYREENADEIKNKKRVYYQLNKERLNQKSHRYYQIHRDIIIQNSKEWRERNPEKTSIYRRNELSTPQGRIAHNMRTAICRALKGKKAGRHWETLVGYTLNELMKHLEGLFEPWMNWDNHGEWHIDHIKPKSLFHYKTTEDKEFKECWALENLQPLEAIKNLTKSNHYVFA